MTDSPLGAGSAVYENDILGNRTWRNHNVNTSTVTKYKWDELNRMTSLQGTSDGATYTYRADGMRTRKVSGIFIAFNVADESTVSGYYDGFNTDRPTWRFSVLADWGCCNGCRRNIYRCHCRSNVDGVNRMGDFWCWSGRCRRCRRESHQSMGSVTSQTCFI